MRKKLEGLLLGLTAMLCWAFLYPKYTFTTDSYQTMMEEAEDLSQDEECRQVCEMARKGKVKFRFQIVESIRKLLK